MDIKKTKVTYKNLVADELKYEDYKNFLLNKSYMRRKMNRL